MSPKSQPHTRTHLPRRTVSIIGTGSYLPERVMPNSEIEKLVDTSDEWIASRTGIRERRIADETDATSDLATKAAQSAIENAGIKADEIDLIIVATITPDHFMPSTACIVQTKIGATKAVCFDISAACSGFLYGIEIAQQFITSHTYNTILVIGAEKLSSVVDWTDRNTCVLFGDGAGAAILRHRAHGHGVIATRMGSNGELADLLQIPGGGSAKPIHAGNVHEKLNTIRMEGRETFKHAVTNMVESARQVLDDAGLDAEDLACVIPHQANLRIISAVAERLNVPIDRVMVNLDRFGNTSAAAVAIALDEANRTGRMKVGDYVLLVVFGGGMTWASSVIQW